MVVEFAGGRAHFLTNFDNEHGDEISDNKSARCIDVTYSFNTRLKH